jgi:hypothetical protein
MMQIRKDKARCERIKKYLLSKPGRKSAGTHLEDVKNAERGNAHMLDSSASAGWDAYGAMASTLGESSMADETNAANLRVLQAFDIKTSQMTAAEYAAFSENRRASFTHRHSLKFSQWCGLRIGLRRQITDDALEILGLVASDMVKRLTTMALEIQAKELSLELVSGIGPFVECSSQTRPPVGQGHIQQAYGDKQRARRPSFSKKGFQLI